MAEKKAAKQTEETKQAETSIKRIKVIAPVDPTNGAKVLRFHRDGRKKPIDIISEQVLTVGENEDITQDEASRLMNYSGWTVEEIKEGNQ